MLPVQGAQVFSPLAAELRSSMPQLKILQAATKSQRSQHHFLEVLKMTLPDPLAIYVSEPSQSGTLDEPESWAMTLSQRVSSGVQKLLF